MRRLALWFLFRRLARTGLRMPGVVQSPSFGATLQQTLRRIRALETQQQMVISDQQGRPVIVTGAIPGTNPPQYGFQLVNPATGDAQGFLGETDTGNPCLQFFNSSGQVQVQLDVNGLHFANPGGATVKSLSGEVLTIDGNGLHQYDSSGNQIVLLGELSPGFDGLGVYSSGGTLEVQLGLLNASPAIYGLAVLNYAGVLQQVGGIIPGALTGASNVTNTVWTGFSPSGSVTAEIGPSGEAWITLNAHIATGTSGQFGSVNVEVDGVVVTGYPTCFLSSSASGGSAAACAIAYVMTGLTAGVHTFTPVYETANNGTATVTFANVQLTVQPL